MQIKLHTNIEVEGRQTQIKRHITVANEEAERQAQDWKGDVEIGLKQDGHCNKLIDMMIEFVAILHGHPGCTSVAK